MIILRNYQDDINAGLGTSGLNKAKWGQKCLDSDLSDDDDDDTCCVWNLKYPWEIRL